MEHLTPGQRETSHDPRNVLEYLNQHIMRNSAGKVVPPESLASQSDASLKSMTKDLDRLPLALFDAVIFPGWSMPIHIYEPRYRIMVINFPGFLSMNVGLHCTLHWDSQLLLCSRLNSAWRRANPSDCRVP